LLSVLLSGGVMAAGTGISLENAVKIAKSAFDIPESYSKFDSNYDEYDGNVQWRLSWRNPDKAEESVEVTVDGKTGEIKYMWKSVPYDSEAPRTALPKYTASDAVEIAKEFLKRIDPEKAAQAEYNEEYMPPRPLIDRSGPVRYYLNFQRKVNGILYSANNINISVSGDTGEVVSYSLNWDNDAVFPEAGDVITADAAEKVLNDNGVIRLEYMRIDDNKDIDKVPEVRLIYRLCKTQAGVDALTGEYISNVYLSGPIYYEKSMAAGQGVMDQRAPELTKEERQNVDQVAGLLSKDEAVKKAKTYFNVPSEYTLNSANLNRNWSYPRDYQWSFYWNKEDREKGYYSNIRITVDAETGEIMSYNYHDSDMYKKDDKKQVLSKETAEQLARNLVKKLKPSLYKKVELIPEETPPYYIQEEPPSYNFLFTHKIGEAYFPANNIRVAVNSYTNKITSFNCTWTDLPMPSVEGIKTIEEAQDSFFDQIGIELAYVKAYNPDKAIENPEKPEIKLVYKFKSYQSNMMDANTLELIDHQGKPVEIKNRVPFTDISGHEFESDIELLYELGLIGGDGDKFRPDDVVTNAEFLKMLVDAIQPDYYMPIVKVAGIDSEKWYSTYYSRAKAAGIIDEKQIPDPEGKVNRAEAGKMMLKALRLNFVANISGIYSPQSKDAVLIPNDMKGVAALTMGLGVIKPVEGRFEMNRFVSRGEAASYIIGLLKIEH
jgi:hypothetical protein